MADANRMSMAQQKRYLAEQIWLHYYNDYLFGKGIITKEISRTAGNTLDSIQYPLPPLGFGQ